MLKHDSRDPLAGVINKAIELAEEVQKRWHIDDRQAESLSGYIRLAVICEVNRMKADELFKKKEGIVIIDETTSYNDLFDDMREMIEKEEEKRRKEN